MSEGGGEQIPARDLGSATARLGASLMGLLRTRLELASVEYSEERDRIQRQLTLLVAAMAMFMFALLFVATWVIVYFWDTSRLTAIAIVAIVFAGAGAIFLSLRSQSARAAPTPFAATLAELERDRSALAGGVLHTPKTPPTP